MPNAYTGRILTILAVIYVAICAIFPRAPFSVFQLMVDEPVSMQHNLRPGIDMVGGTSLLYEIQATDSAASTDGLAQQVASALKKRVDPNGVLNLIWRPQGDTRLEIQMPLSGNSEVARQIRGEYLAAQENFSRFNISPAQVIRVVENLEGEARNTQLQDLAFGSARRQAVFDELVAAYDRLSALQAQGEDATVVEVTEAQNGYDQAVAKLDDLNQSVDEAQVALDSPDEALREANLARLAAANVGFPERQAALEAFIENYGEYREIRDEINDTASLKRLLRGSGVLEFHILATDLPPQEFSEMLERLRTIGARPRATDEVRWYPVDNADVAGNWQTWPGPDGQPYVLAYSRGERSLDDSDGDWGLSRSYPAQDGNNGRAVGFDFDTIGSRLFGELTGGNVNQPMAVTLDGRVVSLATINERITRSGIISGPRGGFSNAEAEYLISTLNAGALPAKLSEDPIYERTVGPQLGADNLRAGLFASYAGLFITAFFLMAYYYKAGVVATIAVLMNMAIILGSMAALNATFTLPSIAGIILSLGMSVDANVLIFERLREEQERGLSIRMALRNAYDRAFSAIMDSNITTGITALVLYIFGSEEVAGFGLTLLIGIFASLFTALFVTKTIFGIMIDKFGTEDLNSLPRKFPKWNRLLTPKIDWMGKARLFGLISTFVVAIGCALFAWAFTKGNVLDIEFAGGTTAQFELKEPMEIGAVRGLLPEEGALAGRSIVSVDPPANLPDDTTYEVVVPNEDESEVTQAIVQALGDRLNQREASTFNAFGADFEEALGAAILPIADASMEIEGLRVDPDDLAAHVGGVAIVLRDLEPMLSEDELRSRFNDQRLKGIYNAEGLRGSVNVDVTTFDSESAAIVFVSNERFMYDTQEPEVLAAWEREFAQPAWQLVREAVAHPDELQKVTSIGAQVAGEFQRDAVIALFLSVLAIMAYVWIRFGDLKFGGATVMALAHDTLFCIAALGYAHLLADTFFGDMLLLDPFRLNLTMVAAILTVMGFSMNDTVVVFDRIRENRGKYGVLTRQVVNDSINQTLSRTLLTGGTTIVAIFVMYVWGGPGVHGFTYAMLLGTITGTYSSIAIASPLLLWGRREETVPAAAPATV